MKRKSKKGKLHRSWESPIHTYLKKHQKSIVNPGFGWPEDDVIKVDSMAGFPEKGYIQIENEILASRISATEHIARRDRESGWDAMRLKAESEPKETFKGSGRFGYTAEQAIAMKDMEACWQNGFKTLEREAVEEKNRAMLADYRSDFHHRNLLGNMFSGYSNWGADPAEDLVGSGSGGYSGGGAGNDPYWTYYLKGMEGLMNWKLNNTSELFKDTFGKAIKEIEKGRKHKMEDDVKRVLMWMAKENYIDSDISAIKLMELERELIKVIKDEEED